ncbi:hypothetical protein GCM10016455_09330 [Aliiroseovarius zhejiangensis]|uniref:Caspase family p20 domain-containing protein n=1 Tax=Aliiroseovarius zhejiangensis TaxID=1632025 RepID=A0ABQ3IQG8_9RHOB|nr:caspase family protein [Aliiroseovarius zhejiangensis]GHE91589.1 hypothetical protein GCM10016455_09330 [Aliiroseovarius zhejiangensis]
MKEERSGAPQIVLLLHGIRTRAWWQGPLSILLEEETGTTVIPVKYGRFDLLRFLLPFRFLKTPTIRKIERRIEETLHRYPDHEVTIIAHSFGTYALSRVLLSNPRIRLKRIILCGSIIAQDFPWDRLASQFPEAEQRNTIVNECGMRDIWPLAAKSLTWGYGTSGVDGFGAVAVRDRFHDLGHSEFLSLEFAREFWVPLIREDRFVVSKVEASGVRPNWALGMLRLPYRYVVIAALIGALALSYTSWFGTNRYDGTEKFGTMGLAGFDAPTRSLVMYATAPGKVAFDVNTIDGKTSPFSYALSEALRDGATDVDYIAPKIKAAVSTQTSGDQVPDFQNELGVSLNLADRSFRKIALIVGNADYINAPDLQTPISDVVSVSSSFRDLGFMTLIATDVSLEELNYTLDGVVDLIEASEAPTIVAFYYSGHGVQVDNENYMLPVDADIQNKRDLEAGAMTIRNVIRAIRESTVEYTLILLDACRDNPFIQTAALDLRPAPVNPIESGVDGFTVLMSDSELATGVHDLLLDKCAGCHNSSGMSPNLETLERIAGNSSLITAGNPAESGILRAMSTGSEHDNIALSQSDFELLECWISRGAIVPDEEGSNTRGLVLAPEYSTC